MPDIDKLTPQARLVLDYLRSGRSLTNLIAATSLRVYALPRRISDLTAAGYTIVKERKKDHLGATYVAYSLAPEAKPTE